MFMISSCKKDLSSLNRDPKNPASVPATTLFLFGEKSLTDVLSSTSVSSAPFRILAQSWTENTYTYEAQYKFSAYQAPDGFWNNIYGQALNNLQDAKRVFPSNVVDPAILRNDLIITDILEVYAYNVLVNTYGNIPYSQAENATIPFPKYDDAKTITYDLIHRLDTCIAGINLNTTAMGSADQIYKGNVAKWKSFAATLKLKLALLIADKDQTMAAAKVNEAVTTGVFQSNNDNALLGYQSSPVANTNPVWQALVNSGRHDFSPANLLVNTMVQWNDPRVPLYFTTDPNGNYSGGIPGAGNSYGNFSQFSAQWLSPTKAGVLLDYSESEFLLAEAVERGFSVSGTAQSHYNNAITASIQFWSGSASSAATYLAQPQVAYTTAAGDWKQKIGYQKWIALADRGWDAWTEIRRLKQPNIDVVNPPVGASGKLPLRYTYPTIEQSSNSKNWSDAVQAQSGGSSDVVSTKLWWMM